MSLYPELHKTISEITGGQEHNIEVIGVGLGEVDMGMSLSAKLTDRQVVVIYKDILTNCEKGVVISTKDFREIMRSAT